MKTKYKNIITVLACLLFGAFQSSCDEDHAGTMEFSKGVKILSFKTNGIDASINDANQTITAFLPWSYNLTSIATRIETSEGAVVNPENNQVVDFSTAQTYRVTNGNLFNTYSVTVSHSKMMTFNIGKYAGVINDEARTITVKYPIGEPVNSLFTTYAVSTGASVSKESDARYDYSNPVTFTLSHLGETFSYVVTVVPVNFQPVGFLGTADQANAIENGDEKAAYNWFSQNVPNAQYISFADVRDGKVNLSEYSVLWWHLDTDSKDIPSVATSSGVVNSLKTYYKNGGSFFLSSWAVQYVTTLGIAKDGKAVNNIWNDGGAPFVVGDDWGLCFTGKESHPAFEGLKTPAGEPNKAYLLSKGVKAKGHNALWNFEWGDYAHNIPLWTEKNGAINLASFHWNVGLDRSAMFEYPGSEGSGATICIGVESYDWQVDEGVNSYASNIEKMTSNIISYLSK